MNIKIILYKNLFSLLILVRKLKPEIGFFPLSGLSQSIHPSVTVCRVLEGSFCGQFVVASELEGLLLTWAAPTFTVLKWALRERSPL